MKRLIVVLAILLTPSLSWGYLTVSGTITADETLIPGTTYLIVSDYNTGAYTLTIPSGVIVKLYNASIKTTNTAGDLAVTGTLGSPVYFTSCEDDTLGQDTSGHASCTGTEGVPAPGDWNSIDLSISRQDPSVIGAVIKYATIPINHGSSNNGYGMIVKDNVITDFAEGSGNYGIWSDGTTSAAERSFTVENNFVHHNPSSYYADSGCIGLTIPTFADVNLSVSNNICLLEGAGAGYTIAALGNSGDIIAFENNTIIGVDTVSSTHFEYINAYNNVFYNGKNVFWSTGSTHDYNICYSMSDGDDDCAGSNESYSDPVISTHSHFLSRGGVPDWAVPYHFDDATSPTKDAGNKTAAAAGLDDRHSLDPGSDGIMPLDTSTVDLGFHFPSPTLVPSAVRLGGVSTGGLSAK